MALPTGYYRNQGLLSNPQPSGGYGHLPFADQEAAARAANSPAPQQPGMDGTGWTGVIGGTRVYMGDVPASATQAEAEARFRNDPRYYDSAGQGYMSPQTWNHLNPDASAAERKEYQDRYNWRQTQIYNANESLAQSSGLGPLGIIGAGILAAAGGAAAVGALGGGGAGAAGAGVGGAGGTGAAGVGGTGAVGTAGTSAVGTGAAGTAGTSAAGLGGAVGSSAIPEIIVTGSSGGLTAGGAAGAAGGAAGAGSFWNNMHNAASDTSSLNATNEQYLNNLEAPTAQYGVDWMDIIKRGGSLLGGGQPQQQMPVMGGGMPGLMGGGGSVAGGVAPQRSRVLRSPLERYMALSQMARGNRDG